MPVFSHLVDYILHLQDNPTNPKSTSISAADVAKQLFEAGAEAEAGSLLLQAQSSHPLLQTFNSALTSVCHWFKKSS